MDAETVYVYDSFNDQTHNTKLQGNNDDDDEEEEELSLSDIITIITKLSS